MTETKTYCDFCKKEVTKYDRYKLPCFVLRDVKDAFGNLYQTIKTNEIMDEHKDVCPTCRKKMTMLLEALPRTTIEEELSDSEPEDTQENDTPIRPTIPKGPLS